LKEAGASGKADSTWDRVIPPAWSLSIKGLIGRPKARSLSPCMSCLAEQPFSPLSNCKFQGN